MISVSPPHELLDDGGLHGVDRTELQYPDPVAREVRLVESQVAQRLAEIEVRLPRGHDADPVGGGAADQAVDAAGADVFGGERQPYGVQAAFQRGEAGAQQMGARTVAVRCGAAARGQDRRAPAGVDCRGAGRVRHVGDHLHRGPDATGPGQFHGMQSVVQDVLRIRRVEDRQRQVRQGAFGSAGHRRGLGHRIVADERERTARGRDAHEVGVPEGIGRAVQPRGLAVPEPDHTVRPHTGRLARQLAAHHRGGRQFLVQPRLMGDGVLGQQRGASRELQVEAGQR